MDPDSLLASLLKIPQSEPTKDPIEWKGRQNVMGRIASIDKSYFQAFNTILKELLYDPPIITDEWIRTQEKIWPQCSQFCKNEDLGELWLKPCVDLKFNNLRILTVARTHESALGKAGLRYSYERLEFGGDNLLSELVTQWLVEAFAEFREGPLSQARSVLLGNNFLARKMVRRLLAYNEVHQSHQLKVSSLVLGHLRVLEQPDVDRIIKILSQRNPNNDFQECFEEIRKKKIQAVQHKQRKRLPQSTAVGDKNDTGEDVLFNHYRFKPISDLYEALVYAFHIDCAFDSRVSSQPHGRYSQ